MNKDFDQNVPPGSTIRFLVLDVDGTLTDGGMYISESGDEFKRFNTKDGMAIKHLTKRGFPVAFLSSGLGKVMVQRRADMLGVTRCFVGEGAKLPILDAWRTELGLSWNEIAYIGDDVNDQECINQVGFSACPGDAHPSIRSTVNVVLEQPGGQACVREFIDQYLTNPV
jgi:3-deoxy-D-manno-octulosonate 8-phosphate phosphatase (KDO 8-P phosphatase)